MRTRKFVPRCRDPKPRSVALFASRSPTDIAEARRREDAEREASVQDARASGSAQWVPRGDVRGSFLVQMERDLVLEGLARPSSGTLDKHLHEDAVDVTFERYSFWSKIRGVNEYLQLPTTRVWLEEQEAERDDRIKNVVANEQLTPQGRSSQINSINSQCAAFVSATLPEPMRVNKLHWKQLCCYTELVHDEDDARAFLDPDADINELSLAIDAGMHKLLIKYPTLCLAHATLTTVWCAYLVNDQTYRDETGTSRRIRLLAKHKAADGLALHLAQQPEQAEHTFPTAAVEVIARALASACARTRAESGVMRIIRTALCLLVALPGALVRPHTAVIDQCVATADDPLLLSRLEALVVKMNDPTGLDMELEARSAMGL